MIIRHAAPIALLCSCVAVASCTKHGKDPFSPKSEKTAASINAVTLLDDKRFAMIDGVAIPEGARAILAQTIIVSEDGQPVQIASAAGDFVPAPKDAESAPEQVADEASAAAKQAVAPANASAQDSAPLTKQVRQTAATASAKAIDKQRDEQTDVAKQQTDADIDAAVDSLSNDNLSTSNKAQLPIPNRLVSDKPLPSASTQTSADEDANLLARLRSAPATTAATPSEPAKPQAAPAAAEPKNDKPITAATTTSATTEAKTEAAEPTPERAMLKLPGNDKQKEAAKGGVSWPMVLAILALLGVVSVLLWERFESRRARQEFVQQRGQRR